MRTALLFGALLALSSPAFAIYKCESAGAIVYRDMPCPDGEKLDIDESTPGDRREATRRAARERIQLKRLQDARARKSSSDAKEERRVARAKVALRKKCEKLAMQKEWAVEDAASATERTVNAAKRKARRAREKYRLECESTEQKGKPLIGIGFSGE